MSSWTSALHHSAFISTATLTTTCWRTSSCSTGCLSASTAASSSSKTSSGTRSAAGPSMARVASWLRFAAPPSSTPLRRSRPRWGGAAGGNLPCCSLCFVGFLRGTEFLQLDSYCAQHSFWVTAITSEPSSWTLDWRLCCRHADDCAVFASSSCLIAALCTLLLFYTHTGRWVCELKGSKKTLKTELMDEAKHWTCSG